jgi:Zn-dependent protease/predicted transcriptional regulator
LSVQITKVKGIPIRLHFTLVIAIALISFTLASGFLPFYFPGRSTAEYWAMGIVGVVIMFISVFIHEVAHSILAERYGVKVREIMLFVFGGVSDITEELKDYRKDFKMAAAGPITSFALAGLFGLAWWLISTISPVGIAARIIIPILYYSALLNMTLGAFNLIPAFPSDGGRILRSILMSRKKDYNEATKTAANIGIGISYVFMGIGFILMFSGDLFGGMWIMLIGWFLKSGADSYVAQTKLTSILSKVYMRDIMNSNIISVSPYLTGEELIRNYFNKYMKSAFPVVDERNRLLGLVTLARLLSVPEDNLIKIKAENIMMQPEELIIVGANTTAENALMRMTGKRLGKVFICDKSGELVGMVTKTDILNVEMERQEIARTITKSSSLRTVG